MPIIIGDAGPHFLEQFSWASQIIIVIVAVVTAIYAGKQLSVMRRVSQATFLLELDARFDSEALRDSRKLFSKLCEDITTIVSNDYPLVAEATRLVHCAEKWKGVLNQMRTEDEEGYLKLIGYLGFFETVGMMVSKGYVSREDVFELFRGPLVDAYQCFHLHIDDRQNEMGVPEGLFEHALKLGKEATE